MKRKAGTDVPRNEALMGPWGVMLCLGGVLVLFGVLAMNGMVD
jgi:hypothetical protein